MKFTEYWTLKRTLVVIGAAFFFFIPAIVIGEQFESPFLRGLIIAAGLCVAQVVEYVVMKEETTRGHLILRTIFSAVTVVVFTVVLARWGF